MTTVYAKRKAPLQRKLFKVKRQVKDLTAEHETSIIRLQAMDLLAQHQDIVARMMTEYANGPGTCPPVSADGHDWIPWPLLDRFACMRLADYESVKALTSDDLTAALLHHHLHISQLLQLLQEEQQEQQQQQQQQQQEQQPPAQAPNGPREALYEATADMMHLLKAVYFFNLDLVRSLAEVNLLTGRVDPPGGEHWRQAVAAANLTPHQVRVIKEVLRIVQVDMQPLEDERRELATLIDTMKVMTINSSGSVDASELEVATTTAPASAPAAAGAATGAVRAPSLTSVQWPAEAAAASGSCGSSHTVHSWQQQQQPQQQDEGCSSSCVPVPSSAHANAADRDVKIPVVCKDMVKQLGSAVNRWRMLSGARSAVTYVFEAEQLARTFVACWPYMPITSYLCDYLPSDE